jgi:hypothetical protein
MDIIGVSEIHEKVVLAIIIAAAILLLIRQIYRMAKGKDSGCASCSKSCEMKDNAPQPPAGEAKTPSPNGQKNEHENEKA